MNQTSDFEHFCARKMAKLALLLCLVILSVSGLANGSATTKHKVGIFELKKGDISVNLTNWGASITSLVLPDRHGLLIMFTIPPPYFCGLYVGISCFKKVGSFYSLSSFSRTKCYFLGVFFFRKAGGCSPRV